MKHYEKYTTNNRERKVFTVAVIAVLVVVVVSLAVTLCHGEEGLVTVYAFCDPRPGNRVIVRAKPTKDSSELGYLECGDSFLTDAEERDGWIRCCNVGEACEGWVFCGYVSTEKPEMVMEQFCCVAKNRVAVRRWQGGPQIVRNRRKLWLNNCEDVTVFCTADGWACTSIGYIKAEYLEVDPL